MPTQPELNGLYLAISEPLLTDMERQKRWFRYHRAKNPKDAWHYDNALSVLETRLEPFTPAEMRDIFSF